MSLNATCIDMEIFKKKQVDIVNYFLVNQMIIGNNSVI